MAGRSEVCRHPLRLTARHGDDPHGTAPRYRRSYALGTNPVRHLGSIWGKTRIEPLFGNQPRISAERGHLVNTATIPARPEHDATAVWREIGHSVARAIEGQANRRSAGNVLDVEIERPVRQTPVVHSAPVRRIRNQSAVGRQRGIIRDAGIGCESSHRPGRLSRRCIV